MPLSVYCNKYPHQDTSSASALTQLHMLLTGASFSEPATKQHPSTHPHSSCVIAICISSIREGDCTCCPRQTPGISSSTLIASWIRHISCKCRYSWQVSRLPNTPQGFKCSQAACFCCSWACHESSASVSSSSTPWVCSTRQASSGFSCQFEAKRA